VCEAVVEDWGKIEYHEREGIRGVGDQLFKKGGSAALGETPGEVH